MTRRRAAAVCVGTFALLGLLAGTGVDVTASPGPSRADLREQLAAERATHRAKLAKVVKLNRKHRAEARSWKRTAMHEGGVRHAIRLAAVTYGVDSGTLLRIARCESGFNPAAKNPTSTAGGAMQFLASTWRGNHYGRAGFSRFDPYAAALGAARHISHSGTGAWTASRGCWG